MPQDETIITFTPTNWVTVLLMVGLGFTILAFIAKLVQQKRASQGS